MVGTDPVNRAEIRYSLWSRLVSAPAVTAAPGSHGAHVLGANQPNLCAPEKCCSAAGGHVHHTSQSASKEKCEPGQLGRKCGFLTGRPGCIFARICRRPQRPARTVRGVGSPQACPSLRQISKTVPFGFSPAREPATVAAQCHFPPPARPPAPSTYAAPPVSWAFLERAHHQN